MEVASLHWDQLPAVFATIALVLAATVGLLLLVLPRRETWASVDGDQSRYRRTLPTGDAFQPEHGPMRELAAHPAPG